MCVICIVIVCVLVVYILVWFVFIISVGGSGVLYYGGVSAIVGWFC